MAAAGEGAGGSSRSSFRRSGGRAQLPGTRNAGRGLLTTSCGVPGLDRALGGGLPVGGLLLIEEDQADTYSKLLLQFFLAEGVVCGHQLYLASAQVNPDDIMKDLPCPIAYDVGSSSQAAPPADTQGPDVMSIAWRYQNIPQTETAPLSPFGYRYDLSKQMDVQMLQAVQCHTFYLPQDKGTNELTSSFGPYAGLLKSVKTVLQKEGFDGSGSEKVQNVLRLGFHSLGSALWGDNLCVSNSHDRVNDLTTFLYSLRSMLRFSLTVAMVTIPSQLIQHGVCYGSVV